MKKLFLLFLFVTTLAAAQSSPGEITATAGSDKIFRTPEVDSKPEIKDGMYTLSLFVSQNFKMPDVHNKKLKLFVGFIVETDGTISNIRFIHLSVKDLVENAAAPQMTEEQKAYEKAQLDTMKDESIRVLSLFKNKWNPATKSGAAVRCQYNYPINFNIE